MSLLIHRCTCSHPEFFHSPQGECSYGWCACRKPDLDPTPELIPTVAAASQPVERCIEPGVVWGVIGLRACDCSECRIAYDAQIGSVA